MRDDGETVVVPASERRADEPNRPSIDWDRPLPIRPDGSFSDRPEPPAGISSYDTGTGYVGGGSIGPLAWGALAVMVVLGLSGVFAMPPGVIPRAVAVPVAADSVTAPGSSPARAGIGVEPGVDGGGVVAGGAAGSPTSYAELPSGAGVVALVAAGRPQLAVYFDTARADVSPDFAPNLAAVTGWLRDHPGAHLQVSGYNDPRGNAAFNADLARRRAFAVRDALVAGGVPAAAIDLVKPADTSRSDVALAAARRVEVTVVDGPMG